MNIMSITQKTRHQIRTINTPVLFLKEPKVFQRFSNHMKDFMMEYVLLGLAKRLTYTQIMGLVSPIVIH